MRRKAVKVGLGVLAAAFLLAQFVQPERTNPPADPSASFEAVAKPPRLVADMVNRGCRDCHSNDTQWPWYSRVAPASWLIAADVKEGREKLNFSQWNIYGSEMTAIKFRAMCDQVKRGDMPPPYYRPLHPRTKVTFDEVSAVCSAAY